MDENNIIPIEIIEAFLALLNRSFHNDKGTFIQSNVQGEVDLKQVSNIQMDIKIKPKIFFSIPGVLPRSE